MKRMLRYGFVAVLLLALSSAIHPAAIVNHQNENITRATLDNGLRVVIIPNPLAKAAVVVVNYLVGSDEAPEGFPGTAHALEHMMFRGSPGLTAGQLADITAALGGMSNADTQQTVTQYFFTVPADTLNVVLRVEAIRMRGLLDNDELWDRERGAIEQEVAQDLSNPEYVAYTDILSALFKGTPYAHDALGTKPSFDKTTGAMLRRFHDTWYAPNNAILIIVGDVKPSAALAEIRKLFGTIKRKKLPARPLVAPGPIEPVNIYRKTDLPYGLAMLSFRMPGYNSPDFAAAQIVADVLNSRRSDLYKLSVEGKALLTGCDMDALPKAGMASIFAGFPAGSDGTLLIKDMLGVIGELSKNGIPADLIEAAKRHETAEAEFQKNSLFGQAMAWSQALAVEGRRSPEDDIAAIKKVTPADVIRVFREYIANGNAITAVLTPESSGAPVSTAKFGGGESIAPPHEKGVRMPVWADAALSRLTVPRLNAAPAVTILPNGITLIVKQEGVSDTVSVYGHIRNNPDLQTPKGKEGADEVLNRLFPYGTTLLNRLAYQKALDDIGAQASAGTDFSLTVLAEHFEAGLRLLADNELRPALPEKDFLVVRQQVAGQVAGMLQSPDYKTGRNLKIALLPAHDPALREAIPSSVLGLSISDVKDYYGNVFRPDMTIIVVIGNIEPHKARDAIEKYFGTWQNKGPRPDVVPKPVPDNRAATITVPDASRIQDRVVLAETLGIARSDADYYALQVGSHVLGGGFYARLYQDLRENTGLVYYVFSQFQVARTRAVYQVDYACDPSNVSRARDIVIRNLKEMQAGPVSRDVLRKAQLMLLREIPLRESSVGSIARLWISEFDLGLPFDEPARAAQRYASITAEQVRAAFAKWIRPGDLVQVTEGPNPQ